MPESLDMDDKSFKQRFIEDFVYGDPDKRAELALRIASFTYTPSDTLEAAAKLMVDYYMKEVWNAPTYAFPATLKPRGEFVRFSEALARNPNRSPAAFTPLIECLVQNAALFEGRLEVTETYEKLLKFLKDANQALQAGHESPARTHSI